MPPAIGAAILTAAGVADATIVGTLTLSAVIGYSVTTAATIGLQLGISAMTADTKSAPQQLTVRQPLTARRRGHGRDKLGGAVVQFDTVGLDFRRAVIHCVGPVSAIREYWCADLNVQLSGAGGRPAGPWGPSMLIEGRRGTPDQTVSGFLMGTANWTPAHRLAGLCYTVQTIASVKKGDKLYPEGPPSVRIVADLSPCYDPRKSSHDVADRATWEWSDNAALCILEYLMHESGFGLAPDEISMAAFASAANDCDDAIPLRNGLTEPRYRYWGIYNYSENRAAVLARMLAACDGRLDEDEQGRVTLTVGKWVEPTVTLTDDMVLGWDEHDDGREAPEAYNRLTFSFKSSLHDYQPTDGDPFDGVEAQDNLGGQVIVSDVKLDAVPSHTQGRRLCKIKMRQDNPRNRFTGLRLSFAGMVAFRERFVRLRIAEMEGLDLTFEVTRFVFDPASMTCTVDLREASAATYAWSVSEEGTPPTVPNTPVASRPPVPGGVAYAIEQAASGGVVTGYAIRFTAAASTAPGALLFGRYRRVGETDADWLYTDRDGAEAVASPVSPGGRYEAQLAFETAAAIGDYGALVTVAVELDTAAPGQAQGFAVAGGAGRAAATWTNSGSANLRRALLYRATGRDAAFGSATLVGAVEASPGAAGSLPDAGLMPGDYSYYLRLVNGSGVGAAPVGPANAKVT